MPTTDCLVHLSDPPFLVITLEDIEIAHLERIQYGLRNFDLVIVYKDFTRPPAHINTIPSEDLEAVKDWLNSCDIATSEGPVNLNWGAIMKQVYVDFLHLIPRLLDSLSDLSVCVAVMKTHTNSSEKADGASCPQTATTRMARTMRASRSLTLLLTNQTLKVLKASLASLRT